ncbi:MAG: hypothetical protein CME71_03470 [Halobacteriovorax sp.]|nr:hypothetical protein [Halobacteriovorax sp.]
MLNRHGNRVNNKDDQIVLVNPEGQQFQISHTAHMVWNMLDGQTEIKSIAQKIGTIAEVEETKMEGLVQDIVTGLKDVDLVG